MVIAISEQQLNDDIALIKFTRKGLAYSMFIKIVEAGHFTIKQWSQFLHITERTLQRYKKEQKTFEPLQSEKILEIARLQQRGTEIFGTKENFNAWMNAKIVALGSVKPVELLDNSFGISLLNDELTRIEWGVVA